MIEKLILVGNPEEEHFQTTFEHCSWKERFKIFIPVMHLLTESPQAF